MQLPCEIMNLILGYKAQLDDEVVYRQYHIGSGREHYRIHFQSERLLHLRAVLMTRAAYPLYGPIDDLHRQLYHHAVAYYYLTLLIP